MLVPGGPGQTALMDDGPVHDWLRAAHETLAVDDLGLHRLADPRRRGPAGGQARDQQLAGAGGAGRGSGVEVVPERVVFDGKLATAAGVTAGIDMALALAAKIADEQVAQAIQLGIEYDPQPPFDAGSPEKAPAEIVEAVRARRAAYSADSVRVKSLPWRRR